MAIASSPPPESASQGFAAIDEAQDPDFYVRYLKEAQADPEVRRMKEESLELLRLRPSLDALDVGCGLGDEVQELARRVSPGRAVGVDGSRHVIEVARSLHPELDLRQGDAQALPFADGSFDRYRSERLFQHLPDPRQALSEALRVLRPGGVLAVGDPDWQTLTLGSGDEELEEALRTRVSASVANPRVPLRLGVWLVELGAELVEVVPARMPFRQAKTIERIVESAASSFAADERELVLDKARKLEREGELYGGLSLLWVVGRVRGR